MQVEAKKKVLPGGLKLVAVVSLFVIGAVVALMQMTVEGSAKAKALTATGDSFVLVHLDTAKTFAEANAFCASEYSSHLAVIEDSDANQRFKEALAHYSTPAWIGFADLQNADDFEWVDANPNAYVNWDLGEPTDLCVQMLAATGTWKDVDCVETTTAFFCESPPEMIATAVVRVDCIETHSLATAVNSAEAQAYCQSIGEELYSVIDEADNGRIQAALTALNLDSAFFGLQTAAASYQWVDGRALDFDEWADGQPLESEFSLMRASDGQWLTACADERVLGVVCTACVSQPLVEDNVVLKLDGIREPIWNHSLGKVTLLNSVRVSFGLFINSMRTGIWDVFVMDAGRANNDNPNFSVSPYYGLFVQWQTPARPYPPSRVCDGSDIVPATVGRWIEVDLLAEVGSVQLTIDGVLKCTRDGDWIGHNQDSTVFLCGENGMAADAQVRDFTIETW